MTAAARLRRRHAPTGIAAPTAGRSRSRRCACGGQAGLDGECAQCRARRLARRGSGGRPLEHSTRTLMESRFGRDFGRVRIHTGAEEAASARALGAAAYTLGRDVVFGAGRYSPETERGRSLVAHELAHVVQQERGGGAAGPPAEREAERAGALAAGGRPAPVQLGARGVQRQPETMPEPVPEQNKPPQTDAQDAAAIGGLKKAMCLTAKDGFEYCGLVILTNKGDYRITGPGNSKSKTDCAANATIRNDERVVAYYHSHPADQGDDFSEAGHGRDVGDIDESESKKWDWYLVNSKGGMKRYIPSRDITGKGTRRDIGTAPECS